MSEHVFAMIGAPNGHARCVLRILDNERRDFACECGREFTIREDLVAHHNLQAMLTANVITKAPR